MKTQSNNNNNNNNNNNKGQIHKENRILIVARLFENKG